MQTHHDGDHRRSAFDVLGAEAEKMTREGSNTITAEGEPLRTWHKFGLAVVELPRLEADEELAITRVSIGSSETEDLAYLVFRGPPSEVKNLLRRALNALRHGG